MGKCAVVTGSSRGIGKATIIKFAQLGYDVVIHYNTHKEQAITLKEEIEKKYSVKALVLQANFNNEEDINRFYQEVIHTFPKIDVLVNNAGIAIDTVLIDKTKENFIKTLEINTIAPFLLSRLFSDSIVDGGSIIFISSTNGIDTMYPESLDYDASKAGVISIMHNLARAYAPRIRINAIASGWVETEMSSDLDDNFRQEEIHKILLQRFARPEEIAEVVYFLASPNASYIHDSVIRVDGGSL